MVDCAGCALTASAPCAVAARPRPGAGTLGFTPLGTLFGQYATQGQRVGAAPVLARAWVGERLEKGQAAALNSGADGEQAKGEPLGDTGALGSKAQPHNTAAVSRLRTSLRWVSPRPRF